MKKQKIAIIGLGNMGAALAEGWVKSGVLRKGDLLIVTRHDDPMIIKKADQVWLCVKPLQLIEVLKTLQKFITPKTLMVSIAAGVKISTIQKELKNLKQPVVRVMPNTPLLVGQGMSGWVASREVSSGHKNLIKKLLAAVGKETEFKDEQSIDKVTAISGSGPAYFYAMVEALVTAARKLGLPDHEATQLAYQTFFGAAVLLKETGKSAQDLREAVTSKGGTTEAALAVLGKNNFTKLWHVAVTAAHKRALELGKQ